MTVAFADTFYYLALLSKTDAAHPQAVELARSRRVRTVTTDWVLTEIGDALANPADRVRFAPFVEKLRASPFVTIVPFSAGLFDRGIALYSERRDQDWSLTDCISFVVMQEHGLTDALTGDRHFEQAGFRRLLAEG
jgi:predicted nucleic acid-binding protein